MLNILRPYQGYNAINQIEPWFNSNYNALQVYGQKHFRGNSLIAFSYTWSKNLTDNQSDRSNAPQNAYNVARRRVWAGVARSAPDFHGGFRLHLPFFTAQKGLVGKTLGGWEISGVLYFNTGTPNTIATLAGTDPAGLGIIGSQRSQPAPRYGLQS